MTPRLQRRVQRYGWDLAVDHYARGWVPALRRTAERSLALHHLTQATLMSSPRCLYFVHLARASPGAPDEVRRRCREAHMHLWPEDGYAWYGAAWKPAM